jgi:hypothetical protein
MQGQDTYLQLVLHIRATCLIMEANQTQSSGQLNLKDPEHEGIIAQLPDLWNNQTQIV